MDLPPADRGAADRGPKVLISPTAHDRQLVRAAALGDEDAWSTLVSLHAPHVWSVLAECGLGRDEAVAVSELVWTRLAQSLADLSGEPLTSWLRRTAMQESEHAHSRAGRTSALAAWHRDRRRVSRADCG